MKVKFLELLAKRNALVLVLFIACILSGSMLRLSKNDNGYLTYYRCTDITNTYTNPYTGDGSECFTYEPYKVKESAFTSFTKGGALGLITAVVALIPALFINSYATEMIYFEKLRRYANTKNVDIGNGKSIEKIELLLRKVTSDVNEKSPETESFYRELIGMTRLSDEDKNKILKNLGI